MAEKNSAVLLPVLVDDIADVSETFAIACTSIVVATAACRQHWVAAQDEVVTSQLGGYIQEMLVAESPL